MWVIDQVVRILTETKDEYEEWVKVLHIGSLGKKFNEKIFKFKKEFCLKSKNKEI